MKKNIGSFIWKSGSINDNIRKILIDKKISYYNTFNGDVVLTGCKKKVQCIITNNVGNVFIELQKRRKTWEKLKLYHY